jgi:hypothetical protein
MSTKMKQPALWSSPSTVYLLLQVYCKPPNYPNINIIIYEKLEKIKSIPLSVTKMLDPEIWGTVNWNTYSSLETLYA